MAFTTAQPRRLVTLQVFTNQRPLLAEATDLLTVDLRRSRSYEPGYLPGGTDPLGRQT
jgi:hypothetical protein